MTTPRHLVASATLVELTRLECTARIIPAVLGGRSEVLDLGRQRRLYSRAQQVAMTLRDKGCVAEGCDWPPWMCHAHAHDPTYEMTRHPTGKVSFHQRE